MRISFSENRYNKILLKKMAADILEGEQYSTDVDEDIVDVVDSEWKGICKSLNWIIREYVVLP